MRGISTDINTIRQNVFSEIAKLSYEYDSSDTDFFKKMEHIPYRIIPGEESTYRDSVFLERAIVNTMSRLLSTSSSSRAISVPTMWCM